MLDQFISKIQNVQKDLYLNFSLTKKPNNDLLINEKESKSKNYSIELSNHYQKNWNELHQLMESNVNLMNGSQKCLKELNKLSNEQLQLQQSFNLTIKSLNEIHNGLDELNQDLNNVQQSIELVEKLLRNYEKRKYLESLKKLELNGQLDYENECRLKLDDFEKYKLKLLVNHNNKAKEIEKLQFVKLKHQSNLFQNNFEKEIEEFKRTGKLPKQPVAMKENTKALEEIDVENDDQDLKALDDFLNQDN